MEHHEYLGALASCVRDGLITFTEFAHDLRCNEFTILRIETSSAMVMDDDGEFNEVAAPYAVAVSKPNESDSELMYAIQKPIIK